MIKNFGKKCAEEKTPLGGGDNKKGGGGLNTLKAAQKENVPLQRSGKEAHRGRLGRETGEKKGISKRQKKVR